MEVGVRVHVKVDVQGALGVRGAVHLVQQLVLVLVLVGA